MPILPPCYNCLKKIPVSLPFAGIEFDTEELMCSLPRGLNLKPPWGSSQQANGI